MKKIRAMGLALVGLLPGGMLQASVLVDVTGGSPGTTSVTVDSPLSFTVNTSGSTSILCLALKNVYNSAQSGELSGLTGNFTIQHIQAGTNVVTVLNTSPFIQNYINNDVNGFDLIVGAFNSGFGSFSYASGDIIEVLLSSSITSGTSIIGIDNLSDIELFIIEGFGSKITGSILNTAVPGPGPEEELIEEEDNSALLALLALMQMNAQSGLQISQMQGTMLQNITKASLSDVGGRLFGARSGQAGPGGAAGLAAAAKRGPALEVARNSGEFGPMLASASSGARTMSDLGPTLYAGTEMMAGESTLAAGGVSDAKYLLVDNKSLVINDKEVAVGPDYRWRVYAEGDFGFADVSQINGVAGYNGDTYAATAGVEYWWTDWLRTGFAAGYVTNDTAFDSSLADIDLDGYQVTVYTTMLFGGFYADLLYSFGAQSQDIRRSTLFGVDANANNVGSHTHTGILNLGYNFQLGEPASPWFTGPYGTLQYTHGEINSYTETGSVPLALLSFPNQSFNSLESELGWQVSKTWTPTPGLAITPQVRAAWGHQALLDAQNVTVAVAGAPALSATGQTLAPGRDWLETGAGIQFTIDDQWQVLADYTAECFRTDAFNQYVTVQASYSF